MTRTKFSESLSGTFLASVGVHLALYALVVIVLGLTFSQPKIADEYLDLGYQTFDEPPDPAEEVQKVKRMPEPKAPVDTKAIPDNSPKEIQDEKGEVAGTQEIAKENNIGSDSNGNAATTPFYKIKPKYPRAALMAGTEGWVLLAIDINESGEVENVRVVDGVQRNTFQSEARRAVAQWKYRPFVDQGGHPLKKTDHQVRVDFKLADASSND